MKILFFNYEYPPLGGGAGVASSYLLREYAKNPDLEVDFITSSVDQNYNVIKVGENITVHALPIGKNAGNIHYQTKKELLKYSWKAFWFARKLCKQKRYDLTHSFFSVPCGFLSMLLKFEFKLPYVVSLRGSDVPYYSERFTTLYKFITPIIRFIWNRAYFVIANSQGLRELALRTKANKDIGVIYNGIDIKQFYPRKELRNPEEFRVICGTRVTPRKGMRLLIQALDILSRRYSNVKVLIVGEGDEKQALKDFSRGLGLDKNVNFLGYVPRDKAAEIYGQADVYASPSFNEGMANFMLECMALGMPIVATDVGGTTELVTEGKNGMIIKVGDANDLAEKLETLILNPTMKEMMGLASRARAEQMSWEKVAGQYLDVYDQTAKLGNIVEGR